MIEARSIQAGYQHRSPVLQGISAQFDCGVTAIVGPNGAGKSTLIRILLGAMQPWSGQVLLGGKPLTQYSASGRARLVAHIAQRPRVAQPFCVREVVALGRYALRRDDGEVEAAMQAMQIAELAERGFQELSAGEQQRVALARALAQLSAAEGNALPGKALLADEPTASMDPAHIRKVRLLLRDLAARGAAVVVVLHDLVFAASLADRVLLLRRDGTVGGDGPAADVLRADGLATAYGAPFTTVVGVAGTDPPRVVLPDYWGS